ncbi:MAG TPA: hypothetical protein PLR25_09345 [Planctomycetaceae bacterium]|nr:hypothetical protein [Planctomycetaceae bacterium]
MNETDSTELFEVKRKLLLCRTQVEVSHTFSIMNSSDTVAEYVLESKSCGCLSYLPKLIVIPENSEASIVINGKLTGAPSASYFDYSATYRNSKSGRLIRCRLGVWIAPPFEILVDDKFDGRVVWHNRGKDESALRLVFRSDSPNSLGNCSAEIASQGRVTATATNIAPISTDRHSGFYERHCTLVFPLAATDSSNKEDRSLDLRLAVDQLTESRRLIVLARTSNRCVPSSLFFRSGVASQKVLVLKSLEPVTLEKCESLEEKLDVKWEQISPGLHKVFVGYDGCELPTGDCIVRLRLSSVHDTEVMDIPVYSLKSSVGLYQAEE